MTTSYLPITPKAVIGCVIPQLGIPFASVAGPWGGDDVCAARAIISYLCRELTSASYPEIAKAMGRLSHTAMHKGTERVAKELEENGIACNCHGYTEENIVDVAQGAIHGAEDKMPRRSVGRYGLVTSDKSPAGIRRAFDEDEHMNRMLDGLSPDLWCYQQGLPGFITNETERMSA